MVKQIPRWIRTLIMIGIFAGFCSLCNKKCTDFCESNRQQLKIESSAAGVTIRGLDCWGWAQNNNTFPVRIQKVFTSWGERTQWIEQFAPGEKYKVYVHRKNAFYVYDLKGAIIGHIKPEYKPDEWR